MVLSTRRMDALTILHHDFETLDFDAAGYYNRWPCFFAFYLWKLLYITHAILQRICWYRQVLQQPLYI